MASCFWTLGKGPMIEASTVYHCHKCNWKTSGVIRLEVSPNDRFCLKCHSKLTHCSHCLNFTSTTPSINGSVCDNCLTLQPKQELLEAVNAAPATIASLMAPTHAGS